MANVKRYVSVRLYLPDSGTEIQDKDTSGVSVCDAKSNMGGGMFHIKSRREQYHDSRLLFPINGRYRIVSGGVQVVALIAFIFLISFNAGNWKAMFLFLSLMIIFLCKMASVAIPLIASWWKRVTQN